MDSDTDVGTLLALAGYTMIRDRNHRIWACPCGQHVIVTGRTGSDYREIHNVRSRIRRQHPERTHHP